MEPKEQVKLWKSYSPELRLRINEEVNEILKDTCTKCEIHGADGTTICTLLSLGGCSSCKLYLKTRLVTMLKYRR